MVSVGFLARGGFFSNLYITLCVSYDARARNTTKQLLLRHCIADTMLPDVILEYNVPHTYILALHAESARARACAWCVCTHERGRVRG